MYIRSLGLPQCARRHGPIGPPQRVTRLGQKAQVIFPAMIFFTAMIFPVLLSRRGRMKSLGLRFAL